MRVNIFDKFYYHGLSLDNWHPVFNINISAKLSSADCMDENVNLLGQHKSIRDLPIINLNQKKISAGFLQPRLISAIRNDVKWEMEVKFEEERRITAPDAPSRLSCLYLADFSEKGKANIKSMLPEYYVCKVKIISSKRLMKVDSLWVNHYWNTKDTEAMRNYWSGLPFSEKISKWEYLLDGWIEFVDKDELAFIRETGHKII